MLIIYCWYPYVLQPEPAIHGLLRLFAIQFGPLHDSLMLIHEWVTFIIKQELLIASIHFITVGLILCFTEQLILVFAQYAILTFNEQLILVFQGQVIIALFIQPNYLISIISLIVFRFSIPVMPID